MSGPDASVAAGAVAARAIAADGRAFVRPLRNHERLVDADARTRGQVVGKPKLRLRDLVPAGNRRDRLAALDGVEGEMHEERRINRRETRPHGRCGAERYLQLMVAHRRRRAPQLRVQRTQLVNRHVDPFGDDLEIERVRHRHAVVGQPVRRPDLEAVQRRILGDDHGRHDHRHVLARLARQEPGAGGQPPIVARARTPYGGLHPAGAGVVRGERQVPVLVEERVQRLQIPGGGDRRLLRIRPLVDEPRLLQTVLDAGARHELPHAARPRSRQRRRLERAFDERHVGEISRHAFLGEYLANHRQEAEAAFEARRHEIVKAPLEQLDIRQDLLVGWNVQVELGPFEIQRHRLGGGGCRLRQLEHRFAQKFVDCGRLGIGFREPVAVPQRLDVEGAHAIEQALELRGESGVRSRAIGQRQHRVDCLVELLARGDEPASGQFAFAGGECSFHPKDNRGHRIGRQGHFRSWRVDDRKNWKREGRRRSDGRRFVRRTPDEQASRQNDQQSERSSSWIYGRVLRLRPVKVTAAHGSTVSGRGQPVSACVC